MSGSVTTIPLKLFAAIALLTLGSVAWASPTEGLYHSLPLLLCQDESYRMCQGAESVEACTLDAKAYRESCSDGTPIYTSESLLERLECLVVSHKEVTSIEEFEASCGGLNINLTKAGEKVGQMDPEKVEQLLR